MAISYQVSCPPGTKALLAGNTLSGGQRVIVYNSHATEPLYIGGDENELPRGTTLSTTSGVKVPAGGSHAIIINGNEAIYGRSGTSTVTITAHIFRSNAK